MKSLSAWAIIHRIRDEDKHPFLAVVLTTISAMAASVGGAVVVFCYKPSPLPWACCWPSARVSCFT